MDMLTRLLLSIALVAGLAFGASLARRLIIRFAVRREITTGRIFQVIVMINTITAIIGLLLLGIIWGLSGQNLVVVASSVFALVGVALFANWSILSNTTAAVLLFFNAPYRVGDRIRVLDGDNTVTGMITDMNLFFLRLEEENGHQFTLPNNLLTQKTVIRLHPDKELPWDSKHCR